jgi:hypothetical protein
VAPLVLDVEALELVVVLRDLADRHQAPDGAPEVERREPLCLDQPPPAEALVPADGLVDERGEYVEEVVVRDLEAAVDLVHAANRAAALRAVVPVLGDRREDQVGVVVTFLGALCELARRVEESGDGGDGEGSEECELERAGRVEGKLEAGVQVHDALMVGERVEPLDLAQVPGRPHWRSR